MLLIVVGLVIGGSVGIVATTNKLEAKYVMYTKDGETMTVQDAIKDLYVLAKNKSGSNQTLSLGTVEVSGTQITIPYIGTYDKITCIYGTDENYGNEGKISGNTCTFSGSSNTTYYYKMIATNNTGIVYENSGNKTTLSGPTKVTTGLPTGVKAIVYLDPTDLSKSCNASNSTVGSGKSGCMKWYAFSEDNTSETNASYTMILDHNTTAKVAWNSDNDNTTMKEVQIELDNLVSTTKWKVTPRLITGKEVANITGNTSWTSSSTYFYFDTNCKSSGSCSTGANTYYWLFDYTGYCTNYGCMVEDSSTNGYWTSDPVIDDPTWDCLVWIIPNSGCLDRRNYGWVEADDSLVGVRPVITVSKSNF